MLRLPATIALAALSLPALAEGPEYTFAEFSYGRLSDRDDSSFDADAFGLGVSIEVGEFTQGFLNYGKAEFDETLDLVEWSVGGGFHYPLTSTTDFVFNAAFLRAEATTIFGTATDDGYSVAAGVRSMLTPRVELAGFVNYTDFESDVYGLTAKAWYFLTDQLAIGAIVGVDNDLARYSLAGRFYFGR